MKTHVKITILALMLSAGVMAAATPQQRSHATATPATSTGATFKDDQFRLDEVDQRGRA